MALYEQLSVPSAAAAAAAAPFRPSSIIPAFSSSAAPPLSSLRHVGHRQLPAASEFVAESASLYQHKTPRNNSLAKSVDEDDDFSVPTFTNIGNSRKDACNSIQKSVRFSSNTVQNPSSSAHCNTRPKEQAEVVASHQEIGESRYGLSRAVTGSSNREKKRSNKEVTQSLHETRVEGFAESSGNGFSKSSRCLNQEPAVETGTASKRRSRSFLGSAHANFNGSTTVDGDAAGRNGDGHELSETSIVDSVSCDLEISPDDVVAVIGRKHFWKARRAIINQQRLFALQVFELHRLITVQKLLAASPELLIDGNINTRKSEQKVPNRNILVKTASMEEQHAQQKDEHLKLIKTSNFATADAGADPPTSYADHQVKEHQKPKPLPVPDNTRGLWCFQQPSNQWLIPVMSPSEGLIYKPMTAPVLSSSAFMAPAYGNYSGPLGMPPMGYCNEFTASADQATGSNSLNPNGFALSKSQEEHSYTACKKSNKSKDQNRSYITQDRSVPMREVLSHSVRAHRVNKESELQDSTANSCCTRNQEEQAMSTLNESTKPSQARDKDQLLRVIKVTPYNPKSATESAARIFRSIQEERQNLEL